MTYITLDSGTRMIGAHQMSESAFSRNRDGRATASGSKPCAKTFALHAAAHMKRGSPALAGTDTWMPVLAGTNQTWPRDSSAPCSRLLSRAVSTSAVAGKD